jgi:hypothetical protein
MVHPDISEYGDAKITIKGFIRLSIKYSNFKYIDINLKHRS